MSSTEQPTFFLPSLRPYLAGPAARLEQRGEGVRLALEPTSNEEYSDSQLDDFHGRERAEFLWKPPLRLALRARFSHSQAELRGTAGFGWWNDPFVGDRATTVGVGPQVIWFFFGSPPNNLATTPGWSGNGWFVQSLNVPTFPGWFVELGMLAMKLPPLRWLAQRVGGSVSQANERPLHDIDITQWHDYSIEWRQDHAAFFVDGEAILRASNPPGGPLALVLWIDNQWATLDNQAGLLAIAETQWMELAAVSLHPLRPDL